MMTTRRGRTCVFAMACVLSVVLGFGPATGLAAEAKSKKEAPAPKKEKKAKAGKKKAKSPKEAKAPKPEAKEEKKKSGGMMGQLKKMLKRAKGPVKVPKPIYNQEAGYGLPMPPGWTGKTEGEKIILTSPGDPAERTVITMGPEKTELEASEYLGQICKEIAEEKKVIPMPMKPQHALGMTLYIAGYLDSQSSPPGFGGLIVFDRPGGEVFVIRASTRDQGLLQDVSVLASLALIRFRGEPPPDLLAEIGLGEKEPILEPGEVTIKPGEATLAEFRTPHAIRRYAKEVDFEGEMHRYRIGLAVPKGYNNRKAWPVLLVEGPATDDSIERFQALADQRGIVVATVASKYKGTVWTPDIRARVYFALLNRLDSLIALDRHRVYVMGIGPESGKRAQAVACLMLDARGAIGHECVEAGLGKAIEKSKDAKKRVAVVLTAPKDEAKKADAAVAACNEAGIADAKSIPIASDAKAVRAALDWLLERDRKAVEAKVDSLLARAEKLKPVRKGDALTIYRRIVGNELEGPKGAKAVAGVKALLEDCQPVLDQADKMTAEVLPEKVADYFELAQRFQGTPEGHTIMQSIRGLVDAQ